MSGRRPIKSETNRVLDVICALGENRVSKKDREWLVLLLLDLMADVDVRDQFFHKRRPGEHGGNEADEKRAWTCALYIADRSSPARADRVTVEQAKFDAVAPFRMTEDEVRYAWLKCSAAARQLVRNWARNPYLVHVIPPWHR